MSVVRDKCVYEALCEMSERSSVRCVCMYAVYACVYECVMACDGDVICYV